jgi:uncharacterized membrane protein
MESVHPLLIHFPIALLLAACVVDLLAVLAKRPGWHKIALWNLALGTLGAGAAVLTGLQAGEIAKHSFEIWQVMERHKKLEITTLVLAAVVTAWRLWKRDRLPTWARTVTLTLMAAMATALTVGAHLGGRLVYEFGVGGTFGAH